MSVTADNIQNVLLVDDDANIRLIAQMSLEGLTSWQLRMASSGKEALDQVAAGVPDLILLDMMMPDMDGLTVFKQLQDTHGEKMPLVIFMTAKVQTHEVEQYTTLGATGVITKPFDPMKLADQIKQIVSSR